MNAEPYQPKVGDTVWIAKANYHTSGTVTEVTATGICYLTDAKGEDHYGVLGPHATVFATEAEALRYLIRDVSLTLTMANLRLATLESQAAQPQPIAA